MPNKKRGEKKRGVSRDARNSRAAPREGGEGDWAIESPGQAGAAAVTRHRTGPHALSHRPTKQGQAHRTPSVAEPHGKEQQHSGLSGSETGLGADKCPLWERLAHVHPQGLLTRPEDVSETPGGTAHSPTADCVVCVVTCPKIMIKGMVPTHTSQQQSLSEAPQRPACHWQCRQQWEEGHTALRPRHQEAPGGVTISGHHRGPCQLHASSRPGHWLTSRSTALAAVWIPWSGNFSSWLQPSPALAVVDIWGLNQRKEALSVSLPPSLFLK